MSTKKSKKKAAERPRRRRPRRKLADQAVPGASPLTGVPPPAEHRWGPGQSGNPAGRPPALGLTLVEWCNDLGHRQLTEGQLREVARDRNAPAPKRAAAQRLLRMIEMPDPADMEDLLDGRVTLQQLRESGVDTTAIKKIKVRRRKLYEDGDEVGEEVEREVELRDTSGDEFDRVSDRTSGRPKQQVDVTSEDGSLRTITDGVSKAATLLDGIRARLGVKP